MINTYYSIKFSELDGTNSVDTFEDWKLVPESRPLIEPPEVKTEYVDVPGADGSLDYTEALSGIKYKNREGSWSFYVLNELFGRGLGYSYKTWDDLYGTILKTIHGKRKRVWLESDPKYYYTGRIFVDEWQSSKDYSKIKIRYVLEPWKYPLNTTSVYDWLWNELFGNTIYYGKFDVVGTKHRNLINPTDESISPTFSCTSQMQLIFGSSSYTLPSGDSTPELKLIPGDNFMLFQGNGRVIVDYSTGRRL